VHGALSRNYHVQIYKRTQPRRIQPLLLLLLYRFPSAIASTAVSAVAVSAAISAVAVSAEISAVAVSAAAVSAVVRSSLSSLRSILRSRYRSASSGYRLYSRYRSSSIRNGGSNIWNYGRSSSRRKRRSRVVATGMITAGTVAGRLDGS
jgi:hypothetical protein